MSLAFFVLKNLDDGQEIEDSDLVHEECRAERECREEDGDHHRRRTPEVPYS
jgi:hypothetical protein